MWVINLPFCRLHRSERWFRGPRHRDNPLFADMGRFKTRAFLAAAFFDFHLLWVLVCGCELDNTYSPTPRTQATSHGSTLAIRVC